MRDMTIGMDPIEIDRIIETALAEDIGYCDITTESVVDSDRTATGEFRAKTDGIVCGLPVVKRIFEIIDQDLVFKTLIADGEPVRKGTIFATVSGAARSILKGERVSLNLLSRMSGIATLTSEISDMVKDYKAAIVDTRKTTPGLRVLERYAVRCGGAKNHRFGLFDGILIKDNHIAIAGSITEAVKRARERAPHSLRIEVETESKAQVEEALAANADIIMLDNMTPDEMSAMVKMINKKALVEASGNVTKMNVEAVAATGVDLISIGALTHTAPAVDISLDMHL